MSGDPFGGAEARGRAASLDDILVNGSVAAGHPPAVAALPLTMPVLSEATTDDRLVTTLRAGDRAAVEQAYVAHHAPVRGFARKLVGDEAAAEDIVHETFLVLPKVIGRFRGDGSLRSFLLGIAVNCSRRHVRSAMRRRRAMERLAISVEHAASVAADASVELDRKRLAQRLWAALDRLPHDQRTVFVLCEAEQRTSVEVAGIVGAPEGTVRTRLFHAKRKLRELLEADR